MFPRKFLRDLLRIAAPLALQMLLFTSVALVDSVMLGQLGGHELGAAGLADRAMFLVLLVLFGAGNTGSVLAAQYWGAGDGRGLRRVLALSTVMTTAIALLSTLLFATESRWVIGLGTHDPIVLDLGSRYLALVGFSMIGAGIMVPLDAALRTVDRAGIPTRYGIIETILNIVLNYGLIFGNFGLPALGMEGAAWGTLIARGTRLTLLVLHVRRFEPDVDYRLQDFKDCLNKAELVRFWKLGVPLVTNHFIWAGGVFTLQIIYGRLGVAELAVTTMMSTFQRFVTAVTIAVGIATSILVGRAIGGNQPELAQQTAGRSVRVAILTGSTMAIVLLLGRDLLLSLFGGIDQATLALAQSMFYLLGFEVLLRSINVVVIVGGLKAGGDVNFCLALDLVCAWMIGIPLAALAAFEWQLGLLAVYALALTEEGSKLLLGSWRLRQGRWMKKLIPDDDPIPAVAPSSAPAPS